MLDSWFFSSIFDFLDVVSNTSSLLWHCCQNTATLFTVVVREIEHAEKVIIDTLLLKGVGSPPWLIVLSLYWPCLRAPDNSPTRLTFSPSRGTDLTCPVRRQQLGHWSPNYTACTCRARPLSHWLNSELFKMENKRYQFINSSLLPLSRFILISYPVNSFIGCGSLSAALLHLSSRGITCRKFSL